MDEVRKWLESMLPSEGHICLLGLDKSKPPKQLFFETVDDAVEGVEQLLSERRNVYFGCGRYTNNQSRTQANVSALKTFFLDLDIKNEVGHPDKEACMVELRKFCKTMSLPKPTIVDSGTGYHVYWVLDAPVRREEWAPVARALRDACAQNGFKVDPAVPADSARVLRIPSTYNFKHDPPAEVEVLYESSPITLEFFKDKLSAYLIAFDPASVAPSAKRDGPTKALDPNVETWFRVILKKDPSCAQLVRAVEEAATLDEPSWRAALSIAINCEDRDRAIEAVSAGHPDYTFESALKKAQATKGPYTCEVFSGINPSLCQNCPHWGKIKSPITLGHRLAVAEVTQEQIDAANDPEKLLTSTVMPPLPWPYARGLNGGIYRYTGTKTEETYEGAREDVENSDESFQLVFEYDFYVVDRIDDDAKGETIAMRAHFPNDGIRNFSVPLSAISAKDKFREEMCHHGMVLFKSKQVEDVMQYVGRWVRDLQIRRAATKSVYQFGWTRDMEGIVIGGTEYTATGSRYSPPNEATAQFADFLRTSGKLEDWTKLANFYNRPELIKYQFVLCSGFGSLLFPLTGTDGGLLLSLESAQSGHGKSYIAYMVNSIYGHPKSVVLGAKSTDNAIISRLGVWNSLPVHIDEVTKWHPERMADFVYAFNNGIGKARMRSDVNMERINKTTWRNISLMTSNTLVYTALSQTKALPLGEMMRVLPIRFSEPLTTSQEEADAVFAKLEKTYGVAGPAFAQRLLANLDEVQDAIRAARPRYAAAIGFQHPHRFWLAGIVSTMVAAMFLKKWGILDLDLAALDRWLIDYCRSLLSEVQTVEATASDGNTILGDLLAESFNSTVVATKPTSGSLTALVTPKTGQLNVRIDIDTPEAFIRSTYFRDFCKRHGHDPGLVVESLKKQGVDVAHTTARLAAGTTLETGIPVRVIRVGLPSVVADSVVMRIRTAVAEREGADERDAPAE